MCVGVGRDTWPADRERRLTPLAAGRRDAAEMAEILPWDRDVVRTFNRYARSGPAVTARDPLLVRFKYDVALGAWSLPLSDSR